MTSGEHAEERVWYLGATPDIVCVWLARIWWTAAAIDALIVLAALVLPRETFPLRHLTPFIFASGLLHAARAHRMSTTGSASRSLDGLLLLLQVALLTGLLELSGGPSHSFTVIYVVQIALAAVTLGAAWVWVIAGGSLIGYGLLIVWHLEELVPSHHRLVDFPTHLLMMWLTIETLTGLALHFAGTASRAVSRREAQLARMREQAARSAHLVSLTTLAAGAAHELSTPLATIAVASKELERTLTRARGRVAGTADARLIREEVDRCLVILDQMSGRAGGSGAEVPQAVSVDEVLADVMARLPVDLARRVRLPAIEAVPAIVAPRAGLVQVLHSLVRNAFDAAGAGESTPVTIGLALRDGIVRFVVQDEGPGMSPETLRRAGEPFYTTKGPGRGLGLGLFLARVFAERHGGSLSLHSDRGTTATLSIPAVCDRQEVA